LKYSILRRTTICVLASLAISAAPAFAQSIPYARSYQKPKEQVEQGLKELQAYSGQKLPILDGFVGITDKPLSQYERGFYQFAVELLPGDAGSTIVRLSAKITAWYADRDVSKSGYRVLPSNGRLELDLLDRLEEKLNGKPVSAPVTNSNALQPPRAKLDLSGVPGGNLGVSVPTNTANQSPDEVAALRAQRIAQEKRVQQLSAELESLKEIQHAQAHPQNLLVVRKSGTPIYSKGSDAARVLFQAAANDEFEFLDAEGEWLHIGISGDSRGYVKRTAVELPESIAVKLPSHSGASEKPAPFQIEREETTAFPGSWPSLRGKTVKIYTVQPVSQNPKESGPSARLNYSLALFEKAIKESASATPGPEGVVVIFDSADGGMVGATLGDIQRVVAGTLAWDAFWSQSYMDPVEAFRPAAN
jgi:hypothetical protein